MERRLQEILKEQFGKPLDTADSVDKKMLRLGDVVCLCRLYKELISKDWFMTLLDLKEYRNQGAGTGRLRG